MTPPKKSFRPAAQERRKLPDLIAEEIKRLILANDLKPDDRLPQEKELIELFNSSRGTIREALKSLEVQGLVKVFSGPKGGARLVAVPYQRAKQLFCNYFQFRDLSGTQVYDIRTKLEPLMAESVVGRLSEADFLALQGTLEPLAAWLESGTQYALVRWAELEFHHILARACDNPLLALLCRFMNDLLLEFMTFKDYQENDWRQELTRNTYEYHQALLAAFRREDAEEVRSVMEEHMIDAARLVADLESAVEQGLVSRVDYHTWLSLEGSRNEPEAPEDDGEGPEDDGRS